MQTKYIQIIVLVALQIAKWIRLATFTLKYCVFISLMFHDIFLLLRDILKLTLKFHLDFSMALFGVLTEIMFCVWYPLILKDIVGTVIPTKSWNSLIMALIQFVILLFISSIGAALRVRGISSLESKVTASLRNTMMTKLARLPPSSFLSMTGAKVQNLFSNDLDRIQSSIPATFAMLASACVTLACLLTVFIIDWKIALVALTLIPIGFFGNIWFSSKQDKLNSSTRQAKLSMLDSVDDYLSTWILIHSLNANESIF